jgi:hypothetical protein
MAFPDYSIANDTANGRVTPSALHAEIVAAGPYTEAFYGVTVDEDGDLLTVNFADTLPSAEQTQIDTVVADHQGPEEKSVPDPLCLCSPDGSTFQLDVANDGTLSAKKI